MMRLVQKFIGRGLRHVHAHLIENKRFVHKRILPTAAELLKQLRSQQAVARKPGLPG
jgi:hypothetical protein